MTRAATPFAVLLTQDTPLVLALSRILDKEGPVTTAAHETAESTLAAVLSGNPAFLIVDGDHPEATSVIAGLARMHVEVPVLVLGTLMEEPPELEITVLPKPISPEQVRRFVESSRSPGSERRRGAPPFNLADYLQLAALGQHTIRFLVITDEGDSGSVALERGVLRQARCGDVTGMEALGRLLGCGLRSFRVQGVRSAIEDGELNLSVAQALLDLAVAEDTASAGAGRRGVREKRDEAGYLEAMTEGIEASLAGDYERAREAFRRALEHSPGERTALHNLRRVEQILEERRQGEGA